MPNMKILTTQYCKGYKNAIQRQNMPSNVTIKRIRRGRSSTIAKKRDQIKNQQRILHAKIEIKV